ncbi:hypothetical protein EYR40_003098 [Pleurotus pulmonarius]|nr:hypothetical protein EYR36_003007 [Pleurotus pulmonarius]KAF4580383.1 hypothetical protein EYR40_003098 [Pleurotus pulmonarius]
MPGPGSRRSTKSRQSGRSSGSGASSTPAAYIGDIDNADSWDAIVHTLCDAFHLPNLTTRHGLKKVHADFNNIHRRLDQAYVSNKGNDKIMGGVVGVFAKMCTDSILRDKIIERGFLDRLFPLLEFDFARHMALRALTTVTHHGGADCRVAIALHSPTLVALMEGYPDDTKIAELCIVTLAHCIAAVVSNPDPPPPSTIRAIGLQSVLQVTVDNIRKPDISHYAVNHAYSLLASSTTHCPEICNRIPSMIRFLVAGLRSKDWVARCTCLGGLIRLHAKDAEDDRLMLDPQRMITAFERFPLHIKDILVAYGAPETEYFMTLSTSVANQKAFLQCAQDHDLYGLGLKLAALIVKTEFSIAQGAFQTENPRTGRMENTSLGLPFCMWSDALPFCAKAIRDKGKADEQHLANILEIKSLILKGGIPEAVTLARKGLESRPDVAYYYYAITLSSNAEEGLRAAKKGLKCAKITPFLRFQMLQRAVAHAGDLGVITLQDAPMDGDQKWEEGVTFLTSAYEDAKIYLEEAPPDNRNIKNVSYWYILLTLVIRGSEIDPSLSELKTAFRRLTIADEISSILSASPPKTMLRLTQQTVTKLYADAVNEWGEVISRFDEGATDRPIVSETVEDDLAAWLDGAHEDHEGDDDAPHAFCGHPNVNTNHVRLYRCSWCGAPSAALRKCGGCTKARYCDSGCQKSHWKDHKKSCTRQKSCTG